MSNNKLIASLINFGLSENEAHIYFASLSLGPATVLQIAKTSQIKRTTVYTVIESLKNKGLMNIEVKGFKQLFVPQDPEQLETIIERKKASLKNVMPEFSALYNLKGDQSIIKHYEGLEAVKIIYNELLEETKPKSIYRVIADSQKWFELDQEFYSKFQRRRAKKNFDVRIMSTPTKIAKDHKKIEKNLNMKVKLLPKGTDLSTNIIIVPQKIVFHQIIPPITGIVIENKNAIHTNQVMFDLIWDSIK